MFPPIQRSAVAAGSCHLPAARRNKPYALSGPDVGGTVRIAFVGEIIGGTLGTLIDGAIGYTQRRQDDEPQRRRAAAAEVLVRMVPMVEQLNHRQDRRDTAFWVEHTAIAYRSLDATKVRLPRQWRHLKRSTRACLDAALDNGLVFLDTGDDILGDTIDSSACETPQLSISVSRPSRRVTRIGAAK
ncbi:hypothetical protein ACIPEP_15445 [Curtobacterium sp. NPDC087082]|uniref:hypothetical protein n=1 Tax=Curtobacterium sp. NPDC087082 TaxID=3363966 RepID=UPI003821AECE